MKLNVTWLMVLSTIMIVMLFFLATGNTLTPRVYDAEQFQASEYIVITFSHVVAEPTPKGQAALRFAKLARERTGGRVEVQVYPDSSLYKDGEEVQALQQGHVQLIAPATAKMAEYFPFLLLFDLPFLFQDYNEVHTFIDSPAGKKMLEQARAQDMLALAMWDNGFKYMIGNRPFTSPKYFKNANIRVMPSSDVLEQQFLSLGANPVPMRFSEVFDAKETSIIDGSENTASNIYSQKFHEIHNHLTITNHGYLGYIILTNQSFWMSLPEDIRLILEEILIEVTLWEREQAIKMNELDLEKIIKTPGINVNIMTDEDKLAWLEVLGSFYNEFKPVIGEDYLNEALSVSESP
jgi:C4-dicarboxylate-binding protein DctP